MLLFADARLRAALGRNGRDYVRRRTTAGTSCSARYERHLREDPQRALKRLTRQSSARRRGDVQAVRTARASTSAWSVA